MKITIIGHAGCGKSFLADKISKKLNIPHIHIDNIWFEAGGHLLKIHDTEAKMVMTRTVERKLLELISDESWVSDGLYKTLQIEIAKRADIIIYLDIPLVMRIINHLKRTLFRADRHPELTFLDDLKFTKILIKRTWGLQPKMDILIDQFKNRVIILQSRKEVKKYLQSLQN